jgi:hypothetical protein
MRDVREEKMVAVAGHSKKRHERRKENATFHNPQMEISSIIKFYIKLSERGEF